MLRPDPHCAHCGGLQVCGRTLSFIGIMNPPDTAREHSEASLLANPLPGLSLQPSGPPPTVPRPRHPQRQQVEMQCLALEDLLEPTHPARAVWEAVCAPNLHAWLKDIQAVEGQPGRDATDPRLRVALWVYATLEGVGHARRLARLCSQHAAYRWLCGGVGVNYHLLSDFRTQTGKLDGLLTQRVASLMSEGLVDLRRVAQDGMRVRTNAGNDQGQLTPMRQQIKTRYGQAAEEALVDGGFAALEEIEAAEAAGCRVYAPVREEAKKRAAGQDPYAPVAGDSASVASWRARMGTEMGQAICRWRCQTAALGQRALPQLRAVADAGAGAEEVQSGGAALCVEPHPAASVAPAGGGGGSELTAGPTKETSEPMG